MAGGGGADAGMSDLLDLPLTTLDGEPTTLGALTGGRGGPGRQRRQPSAGSPRSTPAWSSCTSEYADRGFTVIGFPCNQFGGQEPGTREEIAEFCSATYGVTFPMTEKVEVNGPAAHPIYAAADRRPGRRAATPATSSGTSRSSWSTAPDGIAGRFRPRTEPDAPEVRAAIEAVLPV